MPFNGSGVYNLPAADFPAVAGTIIYASKFNNIMNDIAAALSACMTKAGESAVTGDIDMGGNVLTNLGNGTALTESANISQIQNGSFNWCGTAGGTANALTLSPTPAITSYAAGQCFTFKAGAASNTGATTLVVSGLASPKAIQNMGAALAAADITLNQYYRVTYDGTAFQLEQINIPASGGGGSPVEDSDYTAKGDILVASGASTPVAFAVGSNGRYLVPSSGATTGMAWADSPIGFCNGTIAATVGSNALTIELKTRDGGDPSNDEPVICYRRSETLTDGYGAIAFVTAATSFVISSGSTLGCGSSEVVRIHVGLMRNASTGAELFAFTATVAAVKTINGFNPADLITTTAEGGAGAADSTQTAYSTTARTAQPWVYLGYIEIASAATAGQWGNAPTKIAPWQPGMLMPGDIVQMLVSETGAVATGSTRTPLDDTIPTSSEGDQYMSLAITPEGVMNRLILYHSGNYSLSVDSDTETLAYFQDSTVDAIAAASLRLQVSQPDIGEITHSMRAGTVSSTTFKLRAGSNQGDMVGRTTTFNGLAGSRLYGGVASSVLIITEYHG